MIQIASAHFNYPLSQAASPPMSPVAETASSDRFEARRRFIGPLTRSGETSLASYQLSRG